jgi:hypothetical protein
MEQWTAVLAMSPSEQWLITSDLIGDLCIVLQTKTGNQNKVRRKINISTVSKLLMASSSLERRPLLSNPSAGGGLASAAATSSLVKSGQSAGYGSNESANKSVPSDINANANVDANIPNGIVPDNEGNSNAVPTRTLVLILAALWSAVFLGAMDGM